MNFIKSVINKINYLGVKNYYCSYCKLDRLCVGTEININEREIKMKKKNPCNTCKNFVMKKGDNIGYCSLYFMKEEKHFFILNVLDARRYNEFCGPCGKYFEKKNSVK